MVSLPLRLFSMKLTVISNIFFAFAFIYHEIDSDIQFFLPLRLFTMKLTVISNTYTSHDIRITRACMDKLFILHNATVPTAQQLNS